MKYIAQNKPLLIESQQQAYDFIMDNVKRGIGIVICANATGNSQKAILIRLILAEIRDVNEIAIALALSGISDNKVLILL